MRSFLSYIEPATRIPSPIGQQAMQVAVYNFMFVCSLSIVGKFRNPGAEPRIPGRA